MTLGLLILDALMDGYEQNMYLFSLLLKDKI